MLIVTFLFVFMPCHEAAGQVGQWDEQNRTCYLLVATCHCIQEAYCVLVWLFGWHDCYGVGVAVGYY